MARHRTDRQPVEQQVEQAAQAEQQAAGEGLERDADVVHHVIAEHQPVVAGTTLAEAPQAPGLRVVHRLHLLDLLGGDEAEDQFGKEVDQQATAQQAAVKQQAGSQHVAPLLAHQAREAAQHEAQQASGQRAAVAIKLLMAALGQLLQMSDLMLAVAARPGDRQLLAKPAIGGGKVAIGSSSGLPAALECLELGGERLPFGVMAAHEQALLHDGPSKVRAMPLMRLSACAADVCSGSARIAASSCRRSAERLAWRSAKAISAR